MKGKPIPSPHHNMSAEGKRQIQLEIAHVLFINEQLAEVTHIRPAEFQKVFKTEAGRLQK